jgi:hypothetical protein
MKSFDYKWGYNLPGDISWLTLIEVTFTPAEF